MMTKQLIAVLALVIIACHACDVDKIVRGCRIENGQCLCGMGCNSEFRYSSRDECKSALQGRSPDTCERNPCANNGACIQTHSTKYRYKCKCEGTGYYGNRCQYPCPTHGSSKVVPYDCIEI